MSSISMAASLTSEQIRCSSLPSHHTCQTVHTPKPKPKPKNASPLSGRRQSLVMLTTSIAGLMAVEAKAQDIPLFGLRKKLEKVEEEAKEIVMEGVEATERRIETAEKEFMAAEKEIGETAVRIGGLAQAGVVVGAEAAGVLVATSVVNAILGPESS